jgi:hypothetical protein
MSAADASSPLATKQNVSQEDRSARGREARREHFSKGREMLRQKGVPFDPDELLEHGWAKRLKSTLDTLPEWHKVRRETAPLHGVYIADTLYLPENVEVTGDTVIVVNYLVFEGKNATVKGSHDIHVFPAQPVAMLGTTLAVALRGSSGFLNVAFSPAPTLPSFSLIRQLDQKEKHVTFDASGAPPTPVRKSRPRPALFLSASWPTIEEVYFQNQDTSGGPGTPGPTGTRGANGTNGASPGPSPNGDCSNPAIGSNNGRDGVNAGPAESAGTGGPGNPGGKGDDAHNITAVIADGDMTVYSFTANGGKGGPGGEGGPGGFAGAGGKGGDAGNGVACQCDVGDGGTGGIATTGGTGGSGGPGGTGGTGGTGGSISVSLPFGSPGASWSNNGGEGGDPGPGGAAEAGGTGGIGGSPGTGASACGNTGATGEQRPVALPGDHGEVGPLGARGNPGQPGPQPPDITTRADPGGGGGDEPDPELCVHTCSPIIIDTTGGGIRLTSALDGVLFDIAATGHQTQIAWTTAGSRNAFLVLDRNGNGRIDDGTELFGNRTPQPASATPNGFLAVAEFDKQENGGNGDGIIDDHDQIFSRLRLWIDENHDGISQEAELHTLPELGVLSINLNYRTARRTDEFGNVFRFRAKINAKNRSDNTNTGTWAWDVFLTGQ